MKLIPCVAATLLTFSTQAAETSLAGAAYCARSAEGCQVGWRWTSTPPSRQIVQRLDSQSGRWWLVQEMVGSKAGNSSRAVESGGLYRVRACADPMIESTCAESSAFWAPYLPKSADQVPDLVVTRRGRVLEVSKNLPLEQQTAQYNVYQLELALEDIDSKQLPPMTPPEKSWGATDFTSWDTLVLNIYEVYSQLRNPSPPQVDDPSMPTPKEFISDVPPAEWAAFRAKRLSGWPEQTAITFGPAAPRYTITVFADVTCEHCAEIVNDLDELTSLGIRVRFLAYPMAGPNTPEGKAMADIWCAPDPESAFKLAMTGGRIARARCEKPIVPYHYALAKQLAIPGSPGIVREDGELIGGYLPPKELLRVLEAD